MLYPPLPIHHLTIYNRNNRTHCRRYNRRPYDRCRIHTPILAPIGWRQVRTKKFFDFFRELLFWAVII